MLKSRKSVNKDANSLTKMIDEKLEDANWAFTTGAFKYLRLLLHILGVGQFVYAIYFWGRFVNIPVSHVAEHDRAKIDWGGKFKFLTFLDLLLQALYHVIALLNDFFGSNAVVMPKTPLLRQLKDYVFAVLAFPIAHNVCLSFWVVYAIDRELIAPKAFDVFFPNWLNHVVHTNVAMLIILDLFVCFRHYPKRSVGLTGITLTMLLYLVWLHITRYYSGRWAYPLFDFLDWPLRYFMLFGMVFVSVACYLAGEFLNNIIWGAELKLIDQKEKLKSA